MALLAVLIPTYNRPNELKICLDSLHGFFKPHLHSIQIIILDNASSSDYRGVISEAEGNFANFTYIKNSVNVGAERNLIEVAMKADAKYSLCFGDDDFIEEGVDCEQLIEILEEDKVELLVLNKTRRPAYQAGLISARWMSIPNGKLEEFFGISAYCDCNGLFSGLGFISTTIYRTSIAAEIDWQVFRGINYPHVGALYVAFQGRAVAVLGTPIICHRTESRAQRQRRFASDPASEEAFVSDFRKVYAGLPLLRFCEQIASETGIPLRRIVAIREPLWGHRTLKSVIFEGLSLDGEWREGRAMLACPKPGILAILALNFRVGKLAVFLDRLYFFLRTKLARRKSVRHGSPV